MQHPMYQRHESLLQQAVAAIGTRGYWNAYPESFRAYGENAVENGREAFEAYRGAQFYLDQPGVSGRCGEEASPYGLTLGITYPRCNDDSLIAAAKVAMTSWTRASIDTRAGVLLEALRRLNAASPEMAHAAMHTTGQAFTMAFQMAGPHAQERGLEAVAQAWQVMKQLPATVRWERPNGGGASAPPPTIVDKKFNIVPRGVALVIGSATLPNWSAYPGIFASLATGNAVIVKPHPSAVLPLAMTTAAIRQTLKEAGFDPNLVSLLVDEAGAHAVRDLALKPDIRIIDYSGHSEFGEWLETTARQAIVFTQKSSVNCVVVESTNDYKGLLRNLAFAVSLSSGQLPTKTQTILVSNEGVRTPDGLIPPEQLARDVSFAVGRLLDDPARAAEVLGVIQSPSTATAIEAIQDEAATRGDVIRPSLPLQHPHWPSANLRTPLLMKASVRDVDIFCSEQVGPISYFVQTATTSASFAIVERIARDTGSLSMSLYSSNPVVHSLAEDVALRAGVLLSINLTGALLFNPLAGFSDFHGSGANRSANSCQIDTHFVAARFFVGETRIQR
jgi:phenylacetic acid degradation protein paaN